MTTEGVSASTRIVPIWEPTRWALHCSILLWTSPPASPSHLPLLMLLPHLCISPRSPGTHGYAQTHWWRTPGPLSEWPRPAICLKDQPGPHRRKGQAWYRVWPVIRTKNNHSLGLGLKAYHVSDTLQPSCPTEAIFITKNLDHLQTSDLKVKRFSQAVHYQATEPLKPITLPQLACPNMESFRGCGEGCHLWWWI